MVRTSGTTRFYVNGVQTSNTYTDTPHTPSADFDIFRCIDYGNKFNGVIDESRVSNVPRSSAWLKASYHSGNNDLLTFSKDEATALSIKKEVSPYSIRQYDTTTVTIQIINSLTSEIKDVRLC